MLIFITSRTPLCKCYYHQQNIHRYNNKKTQFPITTHKQKIYRKAIKIATSLIFPKSICKNILNRHIFDLKVHMHSRISLYVEHSLSNQNSKYTQKGNLEINTKMKLLKEENQ